RPSTWSRPLSGRWRLSNYRHVRPLAQGRAAWRSKSKISGVPFGPPLLIHRRGPRPPALASFRRRRQFRPRPRRRLKPVTSGSAGNPRQIRQEECFMIVVIGASGAVGIPTIRHLVKRGARLRALTSSEASAQRLQALGVAETVV